MNAGEKVSGREVVAILPQQAQSLIHETGLDENGVPARGVLVAATATLCGAVGPFHVVANRGEFSAPSFRVFIASADNSLAGMINWIAAPMVSFQRSAFALRRHVDVAELDRKVAEARREYTQWLLNERFQDEESRSAFRREIEHRLSQLPQVVIETLPEQGTVTAALSRSRDETVLIVSSDPRRTERLITAWSQDPSGEARLLRASHDGVPLLTTSGVLVNPRLDAVLLGNYSTLRWVADRLSLLPGVWLVEAGSSDAPLKLPEASSEGWQNFLHRLLHARESAGVRKLVLNHDASDYISYSSGIDGNAAHRIFCVAGMLHIASFARGPEISLPTMRDAAKLYCWLMQQMKSAQEVRCNPSLHEFLRTELVPSQGAILSLDGLKKAFCNHLQQKGVPRGLQPTRSDYQAAMRSVWGAKMRNDLTSATKTQRGWLGFRVNN